MVMVMVMGLTRPLRRALPALAPATETAEQEEGLGGSSCGTSCDRPKLCHWRNFGSRACTCAFPLWEEEKNRAKPEWREAEKLIGFALLALLLSFLSPQCFALLCLFFFLGLFCFCCEREWELKKGVGDKHSSTKRDVYKVKGLREGGKKKPILIFGYQNFFFFFLNFDMENAQNNRERKLKIFNFN